MKKFLVLAVLLSIASPLAARADYALSVALKNCVNYPIYGTEFNITKIGMNGSADHVLGFQCYGDAAEALFNASRPYASESTMTWAGGERVITRRLGGGLNCNKNVLNANGSSTDHHWCNFTLDVSGYFVKALDL